MQAPGGADEDTEGGFQYDGWTMPFWHDDIGNAFGAFMQEADAFLLGRKAYLIPGKNIITDGSHELVHTLLEHDLVDELHLLLYPIILGGGKRLLPEQVHATFKLKAATPYPSGVVGLHYERER
jgi:dihydrofolate reductase